MIIVVFLPCDYWTPFLAKFADLHFMSLDIMILQKI
jgi:hypothetical protein